MGVIVLVYFDFFSYGKGGGDWWYIISAIIMMEGMRKS